ncbi:MAG: DUF3821 domain-containing protein, partial [Methanoregulaceae archaeon]|nr:DUF3821 domain-containing protein [Methanoregulaceae archaeon]
MPRKHITLALAAILFLIGVADAALNTIPEGGTAFIGEEGLDIRSTGAAAGSQLAWYGPGGAPVTDVPRSTITVADATDFYLSSAVFSGKTGPWFLLPGKSLAFYVEDPKLNLRVRDETLDFEITGTTRWVPRGDVVGFRIETNLDVMSQRQGTSGAPITIHAVSPDGAEYSSLSGFSLVDIPVDSSSYSTGGVWATGDSVYTGGTYIMWAECNANGLKDNYGVVGKTISFQVNVLVQLVNPM